MIVPADTFLMLSTEVSTVILYVGVIDDAMIEDNKEFTMTLSINETRVTLNPDTAILNVVCETIGKLLHTKVQGKLATLL